MTAIVRLPRPQRFDGAPESWATKLMDFISDVRSAIDDGLVKGREWRTLEMKGGETNKRIGTSFKTPPLGVFVANVYDLDTGNPVTSAVWCSWTYDGGEIVIRNVTGLTSGVRYEVRLLTVGA